MVKWNTKCPDCGSDAYKGFAKIICSNPKCKNYKDEFKNTFFYKNDPSSVETYSGNLGGDYVTYISGEVKDE